MSVKLMSMAWDLDIPISAKMVLLKLADHANNDNECWPGQGSMAIQCSMSERNIRSCLSNLEKIGLIEIVHRRDGNKVKTNVYRLTLENFQPERTSAWNDSQPEICDSSNRNVLPVVYKEEPSVESPVCAPSSCSATKFPPENPICFDSVAGEFRDISESQFEEWESLFKKIDVMAEIEKAEAWLKVNPKKRKRSYGRFLHNWFSRAADRIAQRSAPFVARPHAMSAAR